MQTKILIKFVDGLLNEQEKKQVERYLVQNPEYFEVIGGMYRIKKELKGSILLETYFEQTSNEILGNIQNKIK